jgi:hypothetical protein
MPSQRRISTNLTRSRWPFGLAGERRCVINRDMRMEPTSGGEYPTEAQWSCKVEGPRSALNIRVRHRFYIAFWFILNHAGFYIREEAR